MKRTYEEINAKIKSGDAVVMTAEEAHCSCGKQGH